MLKIARWADFNSALSTVRSHRGLWSSAMSHAKTRRTRKRFTKSGRPIETALLNVEEQAVLDELDNSFLYDEEESKRKRGSCSRCCQNICSLLTNKGAISLSLTLILLLVGVGLLIVVRSLDLPREVDRLATYLISAGVFGVASGGTNAIAVIMLLYRIPCLFGSGVFYRQHKQIRNIIKMIVLQMLFDSEHLENYITRKIHQFSSNVQIAENISQALQSPEAERIIDQRLDYLYSQPEAYYLQALGLSRERVKPMIRPAVVSLCAESAPYVLDLMRQPDVEQAISVSRFREEMDRYLACRVEEMSKKSIGQLMRHLIHRHLGWIIVWGCIFGVVSGVVTQGLRLSLNFNFQLNSVR